MGARKGTRPPNAGKGRRKGVKNKKTIQKEMEEQELRSIIRKRLAPLVEAHIANAEGIKYLVVRERKGGKFIRVHEAMAKTAENGKLGKDEEIIEVWEKDPSYNSFRELLDRGYGKAKEPDKNVNINLTANIEQRLIEARKRVAKGGKSH